MKILVFDNIDVLGEDFVEESKKILPAWRCEQMMRFRHLKGRVQCALGWMMVDYGRCMEGADFADNHEEWRYNEHGKPYFKDKKNLFFNISHCQTAVAVAVDDAEVGIDIEEVRRYRESLRKYVLNEEESGRIEADDKEEFIALWTKKEAVFKYYGTGITHEIKDILQHVDIQVFTEKIGEKFLSVATKKEKIEVKMLNINDLVNKK